MKRKICLRIKRLLDLILSLLGIFFLSPFMLIIGIAIQCESSGGAIFKQERLGKSGKIFKIYKFRTMVANAEKQGDGLFVYGEGDARITKVGKMLRRTSLDEIPQLFNILKGEMSIVGPRPPVTYHPYPGYDGYPDEFKKRFSMKPGITGLAQVKLRNSASWDERILVDIEYVKKFSLWLDFKILCKTVSAMLYKETYTE